MDPNWVIALTGAATFAVGSVFSIYKFIVKVRSDKDEQEQRSREAARAQADEALRIAREETKFERAQYQDLLLKKILALEEELNNEEHARLILQQKYEDLLRGSST